MLQVKDLWRRHNLQKRKHGNKIYCYLAQHIFQTIILPWNMSLCVIITEMFHLRSQGICYYNKEESTRSFREKLEKRIYIITLCRHFVVKFFLTNGNDCSLRRRQISGAYYINFQLCRADYENLCETSKGFQFSKSQRFLGGNTTESGRT